MSNMYIVLQNNLVQSKLQLNGLSVLCKTTHLWSLQRCRIASEVLNSLTVAYVCCGWNCLLDRDAFRHYHSSSWCMFCLHQNYWSHERSLYIHSNSLSWWCEARTVSCLQTRLIKLLHKIEGIVVTFSVNGWMNGALTSQLSLYHHWLSQFHQTSTGLRRVSLLHNSSYTITASLDDADSGQIQSGQPSAASRELLVDETKRVKNWLRKFMR